MERTWCLSCETKDMEVLLVFLCVGCCLYFVNKQKHTVIGPFIVLIPTGCPSPPSVLPHENLVHSQGSLLPCRVSGQHTRSRRGTCISTGQVLQSAVHQLRPSPAQGAEPDGEASRPFPRNLGRLHAWSLVKRLGPQRGTRGDANYAYVYGLKWKKKSTKKQNKWLCFRT